MSYKTVIEEDRADGMHLAVHRFMITDANLVGLRLAHKGVGLLVRVGLVDGKPEITIADLELSVRHRITADPTKGLVITENVLL